MQGLGCEEGDITCSRALHSTLLNRVRWLCFENKHLAAQRQMISYHAKCGNDPNFCQSAREVESQSPRDMFKCTSPSIVLHLLVFCPSWNLTCLPKTFDVLAEFLSIPSKIQREEMQLHLVYLKEPLTLLVPQGIKFLNCVTAV